MKHSIRAWLSPLPCKSAVFLAVGVLLSACGGGAGSASSTSAAAASATVSADSGTAVPATGATDTSSTGTAATTDVSSSATAASSSATAVSASSASTVATTAPVVAPAAEPVTTTEEVVDTAADAAQSLAAPALPTVVSIQALGDLKQNARIMLRDGGVSTRIGDYSYWLFADTQDGAIDSSGAAQINYYSDNSLSSTEATSAAGGIKLNHDYTDANGDLKRFVPWSTEDKAWVAAHSGTNCSAGSYCGAYLGIWPQTIAYDPTSKLVVVGFNQIKRGGGIDGYPGTGAGLATGKVGSDGWLALERLAQGGAASNPTLMWAPGELYFTNAAFIKDGYYYAYAYGDWWNNFLGRVPVDKLLTKSAWTYYAGSGSWDADVKKAAVIFSGSVGNDVFYNAYLKQWVTVYIAYNNNQIYMRVANKPEGPWSAAKYLTTVPFADGNAGYIVHAHPEFSSVGDHIYFSYTISPAHNRQVLPIWDITLSKPN